MKSLLRIVVGALLAVSVTISQLPEPASCQMQALSIRAVCHMPCCKPLTRIPLNCPMMKAAPVHDTIASSPVVLPFLLHVLAFVTDKIIFQRLLRTSWMFSTLQTFSPILARHALAARAPPADVALLSA